MLKYKRIEVIALFFFLPPFFFGLVVCDVFFMTIIWSLLNRPQHCAAGRGCVFAHDKDGVFLHSVVHLVRKWLI